MYAVFVDDAIVYLGVDNGEATSVLTSKVGAMMVTVSTLEELAQIFFDQTHEEVESTLSQAANRVLQILDDAGINVENAQKYADAVREQSKKVAAEVKSKGIEGMKVVGDSFVALGELLRGNGQNKPGCGGDNLSD